MVPPNCDERLSDRCLRSRSEFAAVAAHVLLLSHDELPGAAWHTRHQSTEQRRLYFLSQEAPVTRMGGMASRGLALAEVLLPAPDHFLEKALRRPGVSGRMH